jgi:hypothetical protein
MGLVVEETKRDTQRNESEPESVAGMGASGGVFQKSIIQPAPSRAKGGLVGVGKKMIAHGLGHGADAHHCQRERFFAR